jgi:hypothetical protein
MTSYDEKDFAPSQFNSLVAIWDALLPESDEKILPTDFCFDYAFFACSNARLITAVEAQELI